jgi:hypothetical protein
VNENILTAILRDETVALRIVEPLHSTLRHTAYLSPGSSAPVFSRRDGGGCLPGSGDKKERRANWISHGVVSVTRSLPYNFVF